MLEDSRDLPTEPMEVGGLPIPSVDCIELSFPSRAHMPESKVALVHTYPAGTRSRRCFPGDEEILS